ncbi:hypothetical protein LCGC14_1445270, partial [marine sediment metagenome]
QDEKWGSHRILSQEVWMTILMEEVGEAAQSILKQDDDNYVEEFIQVASVAVVALESYYAQKGK